MVQGHVGDMGKSWHCMTHQPVPGWAVKELVLVHSAGSGALRQFYYDGFWLNLTGAGAL